MSALTKSGATALLWERRELWTREMLNELRSGLELQRSSERTEKLRQLAKRFGLPNKCRANPSHLGTSMYRVHDTLKRAVAIQEKGLELGTEIILDGECWEISNIAKDFTVRLDGKRGGFCPTLLQSQGGSNVS